MKDFHDLKNIRKRLLKTITNFSDSDQAKILRALKLAEKQHSGQFRDEGTPYVIHCLRVATYLLEYLNIKDADVICAALLHDTIEDTDLKLSEITKEFGKRTAELVNSLTREHKGDTELNKYQRKYQKFLRLMKMDKETRMIKACDMLDNVRSWYYIPPKHKSRQKLPRWLTEAETMYLPLAKTVSPKIVAKMKKALYSSEDSWKINPG